jgi:hypothetical protein
MKILKTFAISLSLSLLLFSCNKADDGPLNEHAPDIADQVFEVEENSSAGTIIGAVQASDKDTYHVLSFEIIDGNDGGTFNIETSSGILTVNDPANLDYEQVTQLVLTIRVSDGNEQDPKESSAIISINIIDVPELTHKSISLQPGGSEGKDAVVSKIVPQSNYGSLEDIHLYAWTQNGTLNVNRALIDFDLSSIPAGASIDSASLSLYFNHSSAFGDQHQGETSFIVQRIISDWDESTVTWSTQPQTSTTHQVRVEGASEPKQDFPELDLTSLMQDYSDDQENSFGLMLRLENEDPYTMLLLASSENPDENVRPSIEVYYSIME